jgi:hypothetical protein
LILVSRHPTSTTTTVNKPANPFNSFGMSFDLTAHIAHEDSLLEGANHVPEATVLPDLSADMKFLDVWKVYSRIAAFYSLTGSI